MAMASEFERILRSLGDDPGVSGAGTGTGAGSGCGFLVCLDVPNDTEFGVDYEIFRTGPKFAGVKLLPLGLHLVVFLARDHQQHGARQGFFIHVETPNQVIVRQWNARDEELAMPPPGFNVDSLCHAVLSFQLDASLGAYPMRHYATWRELSRFITPSVLKRCGVELEGLIVPSDSEEEVPNDSQTPAIQQQSIVPSFPSAPRTVCFSALSKAGRNDSAALDPTQRTKYHHERSQLLEELIASAFDGSWQELLGEFQLAFVIFLQLSSLNAFEQWKKFVSLLCSCEHALQTNVDLFCSFLQALQTQLEQIPSDFFEDEDTRENFLRLALASLFELLDDQALEPKLRARGHSLRQLVKTRFGLRLELFGNYSFAEVAEYAPVLVVPDELAARNRHEAPDEAASEAKLNEQIALDFLLQRNRTRA